MGLTGDRRVDRDELLARVELEAVLDALTGPADRARRWHCPDRGHPDEHPSVSVHRSVDGAQRWRCWSGGHGGTAIDAVVAAHRLSTGEAIRWLADRHAHLVPLERPPVAPPAPLGRPDPQLAVYAERAARLLWTAAGRSHREWLAARGLHEAVLRVNQVGADPGRRFLPRPRGLPRGWPAVVYPSLTLTGQVAYLQARYLEPPAGRGKYDNPAATLAANPRLAWTVPVGRARPGLLVVCEGTADALIAAQAGLRAVGVLGAGYPDARVADALVDARHPGAGLADSRVVVCFDADDPGRAGAARLVELLAGRQVVATVVTPPTGLDLTAWAAHDPGWAATIAPSPTAALPGLTREPTPGAPLVAVPEISLGLGGIA